MATIAPTTTVREVRIRYYTHTTNEKGDGNLEPTRRKNRKEGVAVIATMMVIFTILLPEEVKVTTITIAAITIVTKNCVGMIEVTIIGVDRMNRDIITIEEGTIATIAGLTAALEDDDDDEEEEAPAQKPCSIVTRKFKLTRLIWRQILYPAPV